MKREKDREQGSKGARERGSKGAELDRLRTRTMTGNAIDEVFAKTLLGEYDDDAPWAAVHELQHIGTQEIFDKSVEWCRSTDPLRRARAADVIAQLGKTADHTENAFPEDSFIVIASLIKIETDPAPLSSEISALGHIGNPRSVRILAPFQIHPDAGVRFALACALGSFADDPMAVDALIKLTRDEDEDVRDWATFGIGALSRATRLKFEKPSSQGSTMNPKMYDRKQSWGWCG